MVDQYLSLTNELSFDGDNDVCYLDNTGLNCALGDGSGKFGGFSKWTNALSELITKS
jgi:hypothetical protein